MADSSQKSLRAAKLPFGPWPSDGGQIRILASPEPMITHWVNTPVAHQVPHEADCLICATKRDLVSYLNVVELVPWRLHKRKRWDISGSYHRRVQRKWTKRWGTQAITKALRVPAELLTRIHP